MAPVPARVLLPGDRSNDGALFLPRLRSAEVIVPAHPADESALLLAVVPTCVTVETDLQNPATLSRAAKTEGRLTRTGETQLRADEH
ncbi:hypothetical protein AGIG_G14575 [Arapaima gigas]